MAVNWTERDQKNLTGQNCMKKIHVNFVKDLGYV